MAGDSRRLGEWGNWIPRARARRWKVSRRTPEPGREKARLGLKPSSKRAGGISNQVGAFMRLSRLSSPFHNSLARSLARSVENFACEDLSLDRLDPPLSVRVYFARYLCCTRLDEMSLGN